MHAADVTTGSTDIRRPQAPAASGLSRLLGQLAILGWLDYLTGYVLGFLVFYSVPVGIAAWYLGRWPSVGMSLLASAALASADAYDGAHYSSRFAFYGNNCIRVASFVINAVAVARIKVCSMSDGTWPRSWKRCGTRCARCRGACLPGVPPNPQTRSPAVSGMADAPATR